MLNMGLVMYLYCISSSKLDIKLEFELKLDLINESSETKLSLRLGFWTN